MAAMPEQFGEAGFSLMEAIVATVIAVIAVLGLAYTFSIGRGNISRFEAARTADARAQGRMECLETLLRTDPASDSLKIGVYPSPPIPFVYHGRTLGTEYWRVEGAPQSVPSTVRAKMSRVTVEVAWIMSGLADTARYTRLFGN